MTEQLRNHRCQVCRNKRTTRYYGDVVLCWTCYSLAQLFRGLPVCGCGEGKVIGALYCTTCLAGKQK